MQKVKDTARAIVRIGYDGRVHKTFLGKLARERFDTEVKVLKLLEERGCDFVPRLLEADEEALSIVTTNCGTIVKHMTEARMKEIFQELENFGVRHDDQAVRNITYRAGDGRFCIIDFEFATLLNVPDADSPGTSESTAPCHPPSPSAGPA